MWLNLLPSLRSFDEQHHLPFSGKLLLSHINSRSQLKD
jgi:hypothetical protein